MFKRGKDIRPSAGVTVTEHMPGDALETRFQSFAQARAEYMKPPVVLSNETSLQESSERQESER